MPNDITNDKKRTDLTFYASVLISLAIALLAFGFYLDVGNDKKLIDPVKGVSGTHKKGESVTTVDILHWDDDVNEVNIDLEPIKDPAKPGTTSSTGGSGTGGTPGVGSGSHSGITSSGNSGTGNVGEITIGPSPSPSSSTSPNPTTSPSPSPSPPSLDDTNNALRNSIQDTYGITVKYGSETYGYYVGGLSTNPITNAAVINASLNQLNTAMSLYPNGFFREIKNGGIPLTIYLIDSYSEYGVTGVTDSNYSYANISIAVAYPFEETFYHESYHYIERYIFKRGIYYTSWDGYNPPNFSYGGNLMRDQSFARTGAADAYFVNDYAQTSAEEDRASTFEYMMQASKPACLNRDQPVWRKATAMSNAIDAAINCVNSGTTEYWERHL